jgi:hypothetical protein
VQRSAGLCGAAGRCWRHDVCQQRTGADICQPPWIRLFSGHQNAVKLSGEGSRAAATQGGPHLCRQDLVQAKQGIGELFGRVADIKRKAEASEAMVQVRRQRSAVARALPSATAP